MNVGEVFSSNKKRSERRNAFKVVNYREQLGHLQSDLVDLFGYYMQIFQC